MAGLEHRAFGQGDATSTIIGLGGGTLRKHSFSDGVATVRQALELGVNYFDTSPFYAHGLSQPILGEALYGRSEQYMLATKLGHFVQPDRYRSVEVLRTQLEENLRLLQRDAVDVLAVHEADWSCWWTDEIPDAQRRSWLDKHTPDKQVRDDLEYDFADAPVMEVLRAAKKEGKCRFIGITGNRATSVARVLREVDVDVCLSAYHYDAIWRGAQQTIIPIAQDKQVAVVLGGPLQTLSILQGNIARMKLLPRWDEADIRDRFKRLDNIERESGLGRVELTMRFLAADPAVTSILVGAALPSEIEASVLAVQQGPLPDDLQQAIVDLGVPYGTY